MLYKRTSFQHIIRVRSHVITISDTQHIFILTKIGNVNNELHAFLEDILLEADTEYIPPFIVNAYLLFE